MNRKKLALALAFVAVAGLNVSVARTADNDGVRPHLKSKSQAGTQTILEDQTKQSADFEVASGDRIPAGLDQLRAKKKPKKK